MIASPSSSSRRIRSTSPSHRTPSSSSHPHPLIHSATARLTESQYTEYLKNDLCFHYGKPGHKRKEYYSRLIEVKGKSEGSPARTYVKKETANVVEVDSESDSSQYSVPIIKIPILVPNSKGKKILEEALMDYGATVSLIDPKTVKEDNLRIEATS
jgi:hypothetical protein